MDINEGLMEMPKQEGRPSLLNFDNTSNAPAANVPHGATILPGKKSTFKLQQEKVEADQ